jgi:hypothetical protein
VNLPDRLRLIMLHAMKKAANPSVIAGAVEF